MASTKDAVYRRILDYIEGFARSPQDLRNICSLVCELKSPQLAYYVLFYCGKLTKIPEELLGQLFGAVLSEQESSLDESSYCNLTLVNVEGVTSHMRLLLFKQTLAVYTLTQKKRRGGGSSRMPLKKECLPGALVEVKGLSDKEKGEVIALVGEHEEKELFEFLIKTYWQTR